MTTTPEILSDVFGRIREEVAAVLDGAGEGVLHWRADPEANTVAWLVWHLSRVEDDHLAKAFGRPQAWHEGWAERFGLPLDTDDTGYGHTAADVGRVRADAARLAAYHEEVAGRSLHLVAGLHEADLTRVVDERWDPPVTLAVRLVSVVADALQHVGQAALVRGLAERAGVR